MIHIRVPGVEDRDEWLRMRRALWPECSEEEHRLEILAYLGGGSVDRAPLGSSAGVLVAFVAEVDDRGLCGFVEASIRPHAEGAGTGPIGYIEGWYVDPDVRRRGIGRALVEAGEAWARARGCREMASDTWPENTMSIESHTRLGYRESVRLVHFIKDLG
jgi:aminoglycoside 6'-N-acetyltransferase I